MNSRRAVCSLLSLKREADCGRNCREKKLVDMRAYGYIYIGRVGIVTSPFLGMISLLTEPTFPIF